MIICNNIIITTFLWLECSKYTMFLRSSDHERGHSNLRKDELVKCKGCFVILHFLVIGLSWLYGFIHLHHCHHDTAYDRLIPQYKRPFPISLRIPQSLHFSYKFIKQMNSRACIGIHSDFFLRKQRTYLQELCQAYMNLHLKSTFSKKNCKVYLLFLVALEMNENVSIKCSKLYYITRAACIPRVSN